MRAGAGVDGTVLGGRGGLTRHVVWSIGVFICGCRDACKEITIIKIIASEENDSGKWYGMVPSEPFVYY